MILISHRGNIDGPTDRENHPDYILETILMGFNVEIDVWFIDNKLYLGHDKPQYLISFEWLIENNKKIWIHCKNIDSLLELRQSKYLNCFWHETDKVTLTTHGFIWAYPGNQPIKDSVAVLPELNNDNISQCIGICSDYIKNYG